MHNNDRIRNGSEQTLAKPLTHLGLLLLRKLSIAMPFLIVLFIVIAWASAFVAIRYDVHYFSAGGLAFARYSIASVVMLLGVIMSRRYTIKPILNLRGLVILLVSSASGISLYNLAINYGEQHVNASLAAFVVNQAPVIAIVLSALFLKERLAGKNVTGLIIATVGMVVIFLGSASHNERHDLGLAAICAATLLISTFAVVQRPLARRLNPVMAMSLTIWLGTLSLAFYAPSAWQEMKSVPLEANLVLIYLGIVPAALAYLCWCYVLSKYEVKRVTPSLYAVPVVAAMISVIWLDESPTITTCIGGIVGLLGSYLAVKS